MQIPFWRRQPLPRKATDEQAAILASKDRIRIVKAAPGSGKTWLVGELLRGELSAWKQRGGIAALSLTHVARREIENATGGVPGQPHFVGTLDSFVAQHVVRPYLHTIYPDIKSPRVTPDEVFDAFSSIQEIEVRGQRVSPQECHAMPPGEEGPVYLVRPTQRADFKVSGADADLIFKSKLQIWRKTRRISYSDARLLAYLVLNEKNHHAPRLRALLARRFPLIVIDELQDTSWHVAEAILSILDSTHARAVVVGDPNQAIFSFGGATPTVFASFAKVEGAKVFSLNRTRRCAPEICRAAEALTNNTNLMSEEPSGRALVLTYDVPPASGKKILELAKAHGYELAEATLVARYNKDVYGLHAGAKLADVRFKGAPWLDRVNRGILAFLRNERNFYAVVESGVARAMFGDGRIDEETLVAAGIDPRNWRRAVSKFILDLARWSENETCYAWGGRAKARLAALAKELGREHVSGLRGPPKQLEGGPLMHECATRTNDAMEIRTVHQVKGETHRSTVFYVSPHTPSECPSKTWWDAAGVTQEEGRVAFVAATRPRENFLLVLPQESWERVAVARPKFAEAVKILGVPKKQRDLLSFF